MQSVKAPPNKAQCVLLPSLGTAFSLTSPEIFEVPTDKSLLSYF